MAASSSVSNFSSFRTDSPAVLMSQTGAASLDELRLAVRHGLPFTSLEALAAQLELPLQRLATLLGVPPRTGARRKQAQQLTPQESDRLYRIARLLAQAVEVLGSLAQARAWLKSPNRALGGEVPLDLLDTEIGARQVDEVLIRLNFGMFS
jgi:putative toxin-antitoxin system antitoxin component (TIGR02293 family)